MSRYSWTPGLGVYDIWVQEGIGKFGWLAVPLPGEVYAAAGAVAGALGLAALWFVARLRSRTALCLLGFLAIALIALLGGLHVTDYRSLINGQGRVLQGRYLLPVIGLLGLAVALVVKRMPARIRPAACAGLFVLLLSLQVLSMSAVIEAFYL
jgi:hypothetical protein